MLAPLGAAGASASASRRARATCWRSGIGSGAHVVHVRDVLHHVVPRSGTQPSGSHVKHQLSWPRRGRRRCRRPRRRPMRAPMRSSRSTPIARRASTSPSLSSTTCPPARAATAATHCRCSARPPRSPHPAVLVVVLHVLHVRRVAAALAHRVRDRLLGCAPCVAIIVMRKGALGCARTGRGVARCG